MANNLNIIVYTGGTCGDLVTALFDPTSAQLIGSAVQLGREQTKLKKPHNFHDDLEKDHYISNVQFKSISSHDIEYHKKRNHKFISIIVNDYDLAIWAATRFKNLHRAEIWNEICQQCGIATIDDYAKLLIDYSGMAEQHAHHTINLKSITSGCAIKELESIGSMSEAATKLYETWMKANKL